MKIGVLASHRGSNLQTVMDGCLSGVIEAKLVVAISNNSSSLALQRAKGAGIATYHLSSQTHPDECKLDQAICGALSQHQVDLVLTLGYMKKLGRETLSQFKNRIINIHPSLLPKYGGHGMYGGRVHQAVLDAGEKETGVSIHLLDNEYDTGPVIAQSKLDVQTGDTPETLAGRVLELEHSLLVDTLAKIAQRKILLPN